MINTEIRSVIFSTVLKNSGLIAFHFIFMKTTLILHKYDTLYNEAYQITRIKITSRLQ